MIDSFTGKNRFLSNFYESVICDEGQYYETVEHAYQAAKTLDPDEKKLIRLTSTPGKAKRLGKTVTLRPDWEEIKLDVMQRLLYEKFSRGFLRDWLLNTGNAQLIESNKWGDTYWGVCNGVGENHLGRLLMETRERLRTESVDPEDDYIYDDELDQLNDDYDSLDFDDDIDYLNEEEDLEG